MKQEIIDGNKLIAEFMGLKIGDGLGVLTVIYKGQYCTPRYHTSWDWLMPAIEKVRDIMEMQTISNAIGYIESRNSPHLKGWDSVSQVWKSLVKFIKWYNETKPQP